MAKRKWGSPKQRAALRKAQRAWKTMHTTTRKRKMPGGGTRKKSKSKRRSGGYEMAPQVVNVSQPATKKKRRAAPGNYSGRRQQPFSLESMMSMAMTGALGVGGAVLGSWGAKQIPIKDSRLKAAMPVLIALVAGSTRFVQDNRELQAANLGLLITGGLTLTKEFFPQLALMGKGYHVPVDVETQKLLGMITDLSRKRMGKTVNLSGSRSRFRTPIDL